MMVRDSRSAVSGIDDWHGTIDTSAGLLNSDNSVLEEKILFDHTNR